MKTYRSHIPLLALLFTVMLMVFGIEVKGQGRTYATANRSGKTYSFPNFSSVTTPDDATDGDYTNYAILTAYSTVGVSTAWEQLIFASTVPANSTICIKLKQVTAALLGDELTVESYSGGVGGSPGTEGTLVTSTATPILTAPNGDQYILVTPVSSVNSIKVTLSSPIALGTNTIHIYYGYYEQPSTACSPALATSTSVTGITIGGNVNLPNNAIDNDLSTYSTLSVGLLGVAASIKQKVYFSSQSSANDAATVTFSVPPGLLTLGLFDGITLTAYNGPTQVGSPIAFSSILSLDLLFLGGGNRYTGSFVPSGIFDRIEISTSSLASVLGSLHLHEVQRTPAKPTFSSLSSQNPTICSGSSTTLSPVAPASDNELHWYTVASGGTATIGATYTTGNLTTTTTYYVATAKTGCTADSERVPMKVNVNPLPAATISGTTSVCQDATAPSITFTGSGGTAPYTFSYKIGTGSMQTVTSNASGIATVSISTSSTGTFTYSLISVEDSSATHCSQLQSGVATIIILQKPHTPPITSNTY